MPIRTDAGLEASMKRDLPWLAENQALIAAVARSFGLEPAVVAGLVSRESGGGRLLGKAGCPPGTGDGGHGRGLMQIDDRWHQAFLAIRDFWRRPAANLAYGCFLLRQNLDALRRRLPGVSEDGALRAALAAYNCGLGEALKLVRAGGDPDAATTGGNYGRDVLERAAWLRARGF